MKKRVLLILLLFCPVVTLFANITTPFVGKITAVRFESQSGLISINGVVDGGNIETSRFWIDLNSSIGRAAYATALLAFSLDQDIHIRGYMDAELRYGAIKLYDLVIYK